MMYKIEARTFHIMPIITNTLVHLKLDCYCITSVYIAAYNRIFCSSFLWPTIIQNQSFAIGSRKLIREYTTAVKLHLQPNIYHSSVVCEFSTQDWKLRGRGSNTRTGRCFEISVPLATPSEFSIVHRSCAFSGKSGDGMARRQLTQLTLKPMAASYIRLA